MSATWARQNNMTWFKAFLGLFSTCNGKVVLRLLSLLFLTPEHLDEY